MNKIKCILKNILRECLVKKAEDEMNNLAAEGWRVVAVIPNVAMGHGMVVTFEREKELFKG